MITLTPIGKIINDRTEAIDDNWGNVISKIEVDENLDESCLKGIKEFSHLEIIYYFNKVEDNNIISGARHPRNNEHLPEVGIFAQRAKNRPNKLGLTTVKLLKAEGRTLYVTGLDAINGTPVLDIKPVFKQFLPSEEVTQPKWVNDIMKNYWEQK